MRTAFANRAGKGSRAVTVSYTLRNGNPLLAEAVAAALEGLRNPKTVDQGYEAFAKGGYWRDAGGRVNLYLRDCLRLHRIVTHEGTWKFTASAPATACRAAVERLTPKGRYRTMTFEPMGDGRPRFTAISISGVSVLVDGQTEALYFAPQDEVRASVRQAAVAAAVPAPAN